jgi:plasmid stabilization system protein ParE
MAKQLNISAAAENDTESAGQWYDKQQAGLSLQFYDELHLFFQKITANPDSFSLYKTGYDVRKCSLKKFPYAIYYKHSGETIQIIAILHQARSLRFIKKRLK